MNAYIKRHRLFSTRDKPTRARTTRGLKLTQKCQSVTKIVQHRGVLKCSITYYESRRKPPGYAPHYNISYVNMVYVFSNEYLLSIIPDHIFKAI